MLTREQIEKIAMEYLIKNNYPIIMRGIVELPEDIDEDGEDSKEKKKYMEKKQIASAVFKSNYPDNVLDLYRELTPMVFILHVNFITGEVKMLNPSRL